MSWFQTVVLVGLAAVWAWVLGRPLLENVLNVARRDPVGHFNRKMSVLGEAPQKSLAHGPGVLSPTSFTRQSAKRRRLQIFLALCIAAVVSLGLAVFFGGIFWWQHLLLDVLLVGYVLLAARAGSMEAERGAKVAYLTPARAPTPSYARAAADR